jgi:hypothetical protein
MPSDIDHCTGLPMRAAIVAQCRRFLTGMLLTVLLPAAVRADITATYQAPHNPKAALVIEVADTGDFRAGGQGEGYYLWSHGVGYEVEPGPGGPIVMATKDIEAARAGKVPASVIQEPWIPIGKAKIAGFDGIRYKIRGAEKNPEAASTVISPDPSLAQLGEAFRRLHMMQQATFPGDQGPEQQSLSGILSTGAPIDYLDWELVSVRRAPIARSRFDLPVAPLSAAEVAEFWREPASSDTVTADDVKRERARSIRRAVFADGRLWLLNEAGGVLSLAPGDRSLREETIAGRVLDLCAREGRVALLIREGSRTQLRVNGPTWSTIADLSIEPKEIVAGISCSKTRTIVLTDARVHILDSGGQKSVSLSESLRAPSVVTTLLDDGAFLYAGLDAGEWGGGLARIDLATGRVIKPAKTVGDACSGPLFPGCDPVNGVAREPGKPGCVVAAIGLMHMFSHGRLVEVCRTEVRRIYYKPYTVETSWPADPPTEPFRTVPFYGLAESGGTLWAVATDGLYSISRDGKIGFRKLPKFDNIDGVDVSFAIPGTVLLRTSINGQVSLSGAVPMLVSR